MSMVYSEAALQAYFMKSRLHITNAQFWKTYTDAGDLARAAQEHKWEELSEKFRDGLSIPGADGMICAFDSSFPFINPMAPMGDRPFLLFYRGDVSLLEDLNKNVAVIGAIDPDESVVSREQTVVERLVLHGLNIVSGLAKGCDSAAHDACLQAGGKTIAVLPTQLGKIYPAANRGLAEEIVRSGGLLLTEYAGDPASKYESVKRFTDRDRLQAMFSKAVILIASHRKGEGDSGSRYAMESAKKYRIRRYVMFNREEDSGKSLFGLNQDILRSEPDVKILWQNSIAELAAEQNKLLMPPDEQIKMDLP
ncbi:MAG: DNA-protecting protein DprA [Oscillospiraceae bacterium]|nr:DNA-protecting protein DprA [Oscillospiraceae bacterium]